MKKSERNYLTMSKPARSGRIYLDYASTTPLDPEVLKEMLPYFDGRYSNPSSMHSSGRTAKAIMEDARRRVASIINARPEEIIFTGSGTEADNMAIIGIAKAYKGFGNHIIVSSVEHKAILEPAKSLEKEGFEVSILKTDKQGMVDIKECLKLIKKETILISIMYANNEIGTIEPIKELVLAIRKEREKDIENIKYNENKNLPIFHTDACQATGYLNIDAKDLGVDLMTINSSKIYGPKGIGALYKKSGINIAPIVSGGEQEKNLRAGTENIALVHGFAKALEKVENNKEKETKRMLVLQKYFIKELLKRIPKAKLNGHPTKRLPNNVHISIPAVEGESMLLLLDTLGIEVSTGSACSTFDLRPSHVLIAIDQDEEIMHGSLRFTMGKYTTKDEIRHVLKVFPEIVKRLSNISAIKR